MKKSLLLGAILFLSCAENTKKTKLIVGDKKVISFDLDTKDPFKKEKIDTVKITAIKNGYIQWEYKEGFKLSSKIEIFERLVKK